MANIRLDLQAPIVDGQTLTFKSPADCSQVTGLIVYYPENDSVVSKTFQFADAHGNNIGDLDLFASESLVKVILHTPTSLAFVQNADTNAYLEQKFIDVTMYATDPNNDGNIVLQYGGNVVPGGGGSGGSGGAPGADGFSPIATVVPTEDGALITITDKNGTTEVAVPNGKDGVDGKSAYQYAQDGGFEGTEEEFAEKLAKDQAFEFTVTKNENGSCWASADLDTIVNAINAGKIVTCRLLVTDATQTAGDKIFNLMRPGKSGSSIVFAHIHGCKTETIVFTKLGMLGTVIAHNEYDLATEEYVNDAMESVSGYPAPCVMDYGAKGDGNTDDTVAFQTALAENRVVFVPGGTYKLNGTLVIRENCCLELSQDTILDFANTSGNCIEMRGSATLRGNHGNINVYHPFAGNVISVDTSKDGVVHGSIEPYYNWTPMWQRQRFIHDVNITRTEGGFRGSLTGAYSGTALYISANYDTTEEYNGSSTAPITCIWGMTVSGLRIGGAFEYGINIENRDKTESGYGNSDDPAWNHDLRIEAVMVACATGVRVFNCNTAHLDVTIEPGLSINKVNGEYAKYAKNGIILEHSNHIDLTQSLVWDWNSTGTLVDEDERNAHIALIGICEGVILSDFLYHKHPSTDIRKLIYTDTQSNFDSLIILQEPFTRWFKPKDNKPYFFDGDTEKELTYKEEFDKCFVVGKTPTFTDVLAKAIDTDGSIYNGIGYSRSGGCINGSGAVNSAQTVYGHTGFIAVKSGSTVHVEGMKLTDDGDNRITMYDASFNLLQAQNAGNIIPGKSYWFPNYTETENGFSFQILAGYTQCAYIRLSVLTRNIATAPLIAINEEIGYTMEGYLADSIKVKGENVIGGTGGGGVSSWNDLTDKPFDIVELMTETQFVYNESFGAFVAQTDFELVAGRTYIINWNGEEYISTARVGQISFSGSTAFVIHVGNPKVIGGENNSLPFAVVRILFEPTTKGLMGAIPLDGSTAVTVGINGYTFNDVSDTVVLDAHLSTTGVFIYATPEQILTAFIGGKRIVSLFPASVNGNGIPISFKQCVVSEVSADASSIVVYSVGEVNVYKNKFVYNNDGTYVPPVE